MMEGELAKAEWNARRSRYVALAVLLAATAGSAYLVLAVVNGLEDSIGEEISGMLGGDLRITRGRTGLGDGQDIRDVNDVLTALRFTDPRAKFAPRLETQGIFLHGADFTTSGDVEARAAAVIIGIDPSADLQVSNLASIILLGEGPLALEREWRAPDGERLVPVIVGVSFLETGNVTVYNGTFSWNSVYNISAGHVENGRLVHERAIVVGAYETGFTMIDRLIVYAPRGDVARLLGGFSTNPHANVILASSLDAERLSDKVEALGFVTYEEDDFRASYLGPIFARVRVAAWAIVAVLVLMTSGWMGYTLAHHVHEDRRKIATLRAVGIPDGIIRRTYLALSASLIFAAVVLGFAGAVIISLLAGLVSSSTGLIAPRPGLVDGAILLGFSALASLAAVRWAVARAARVSIREALLAP